MLPYILHIAAIHTPIYLNIWFVYVCNNTWFIILDWMRSWCLLQTSHFYNAVRHTHTYDVTRGAHAYLCKVHLKCIHSLHSRSNDTFEKNAMILLIYVYTRSIQCWITFRLNSRYANSRYTTVFINIRNKKFSANFIYTSYFQILIDV